MVKYSPSPQGSSTGGGAFEICNALVRKEDTNEYAVYNQKGSKILSSSNPITVIDKAFNDILTPNRTWVESVAISPALYTLPSRINIPSYTALINCGYLKLADAVTEAAIIRNKNYGVAVDTDIHITGGGTIDGNKAGGSSSNGIALEGTKNSTISKLRIKDVGGASGRGVYVITMNATRLSENILISDLILSGSGNSDLELAGDTTDVTIQVRRCQVRGIHSSNTGHRNIALSNAHWCVLSDLTMINAATHSLDLSYNAQDNIISEFTCETPLMAGINVNTNASDRNTFSKFSIYRAGQLGIGTTARYLKFSDFEISDCDHDGIRLSTGSHDCVIANGVVKNNGKELPQTSYSGIIIRDGASNCIVRGVRCTDDQATKSQRYGIVVASGSNDCIIEGNNVIGNFRAEGISNSGTGTVLKTNKGFNPQGCVAITVGVSPFIYTNNDGVLEAIYIIGGAVTDISKNAISVGAVSDRTILLEPGESVTVTYTTAPTMIKDRK